MALAVFYPATRKIEAALFDLDGVLLDTEKLYARFWQEAAHVLGYPMTHSQALGMRSLSGSAGQAQLESYFGPGVSREVLRQKRIELMDAYIAQYGVEAKAGAEQTLDALRARGVKLAVATSSPMDRVQRYLGSLNLLHYFDAICSGHDVPHGKPAPDIYLWAAQCVGVPAMHCLAVEDSPAGIASAHAAGCLPVFIPDQDEANEQTLQLLYAKADALTDLMQLLEGEKLL